MNDSKKLEVYNILEKYCKDFIGKQEITYVASKINSSPSIKTVAEMNKYLSSFSIDATVEKTLLANNLKFAISEITKLVVSLDIELFISLKKAPLHDTSNVIADADLVSDYDIEISDVNIVENIYNIPIKFYGTNLQSYKNDANTDGYWMGIAIPDTVLIDGYEVKFTKGFGEDISEALAGDFIELNSEYFDEDLNISDTGKYCSFYTEVEQAKQTANKNKAFVILSLTKEGKTSYVVYRYDYSSVTLV